MHLQSDDALAQFTARRLALLEAFAENAELLILCHRVVHFLRQRKGGGAGIVLHLGDR
jgi:hypothetical protein